MFVDLIFQKTQKNIFFFKNTLFFSKNSKITLFFQKTQKNIFFSKNSKKHLFFSKNSKKHFFFFKKLKKTLFYFKTNSMHLNKNLKFLSEGGVLILNRTNWLKKQQNFKLKKFKKNSKKFFSVKWNFFLKIISTVWLKNQNIKKSMRKAAKKSGIFFFIKK